MFVICSFLPQATTLDKGKLSSGDQPSRVIRFLVDPSARHAMAAGWIPAFAGMTFKGTGMTFEGPGMTFSGAGMAFTARERRSPIQLGQPQIHPKEEDLVPHSPEPFGLRPQTEDFRQTAETSRPHYLLTLIQPLPLEAN